jgi:hypothetical protein
LCIASANIQEYGRPKIVDYVTPTLNFKLTPKVYMLAIHASSKMSENILDFGSKYSFLDSCRFESIIFQLKNCLSVEPSSLSEANLSFPNNYLDEHQKGT